jgi:hypothetical protein
MKKNSQTQNKKKKIVSYGYPLLFLSKFPVARGVIFPR